MLAKGDRDIRPRGVVEKGSLVAREEGDDAAAAAAGLGC